MNIILAKEMGFCYGVKRAIEMTQAVAKEKGEIHTLGQLVHNPSVIEKLQDDGINVVGDMEAIPQDGIATITAHGTGKAVTAQIAEHNLELLDATCPIVSKVHRIVQEHAERGYQILIFGDPTHKEVRGILGWSDGRGEAVASAEALDSVRLRRKICLVSQTTQTVERFQAVARRLMDLALEDALEVHVVNTLCFATTKQQAAARDILPQVDVMVVVGGRNSANTTHLAEISREEETPTYHIESAAELDPAWFKHMESVGITAGASTPDWSVQEVVAWLKELDAVAS
ncbi:MAG: 4-hydroxy-3-methylbut-2-enyl diphosphate reductase [Chloroflexi bacterium]|nr:4-hydroxy-3-methylbut-2-enyl diphosphate reductase [Chloroflexota bacterium]